ncbi:MAG: glycine-rich protein [Bacilli bacterium]|nr:glycine-rich protein [Bacilli bacterium]
MKKTEKSNQQGFAISGVIYSLLVLFVILLTALLTLLLNQKLILDKTNQSLLNGINGEADIAFRFDYKHIVIANTSKVQNFNFDLLDGVSVVSNKDKKKLPSASITYTSAPTFNSAVNGVYKITYTAKFGIYEITEQRMIEVADPIINTYAYTGSAQTFTSPIKGIYQVQLWGASGGNIDGFLGGKGAYTRGELGLENGSKLYLQIGSKGSDSDYTGGYNGGGTILDGQITFGRHGGGATDVRLQNGAWDLFDSLKSRIMVASGGGGANNRNANTNNGTMGFGAGNGGSGGSLIGETGQSINHTIGGGTYGWNLGTGGTQTEGGYQQSYNNSGYVGDAKSENILGKFGYAPQKQNQSGGGSGYYAGASVGHGGAGGGSSFISGYPGCNAIASTSTSTKITHTGTPTHYSGVTFKNSVMLDGNTNIPNTANTSTTVGNTGNGYGKITALIREIGSETLPTYTEDSLYVHYDGYIKGSSSTQWQDVSGNRRNGTLNGLTSTSFTSDHGLSFDGVDDRIDTGFTQSDLDQNITISTVMNIAELSPYRGLWGYHASNAEKTVWEGIASQTNSTTSMLFYYFAGGGTNPNVSIPSTALLNKKVQIAVTMQGGIGIKVYLNGKLYGFSQSDGVIVPYAGANFYIGQSHPATDRYFKGTVYNFMVYKKVLDIKEIEDNYKIDSERFGV